MEETFCEECGFQVNIENLCEHYVIAENVESDEVSNNVTFEEQLISFMQDAPALWDPRLPIVERTKTIKENLWLDIYNKFGGKYVVVSFIIRYITKGVICCRQIYD